MVSKRVIMPLLYKKVTTFKGPTWYFAEGIYLETIYDEDYGAFHREGLDDYYRSGISTNTTCIYLDEPNFEDFAAFAKRAATQIKFVLNNFALQTPVVIPYAALISTGKKSRVAQIVDIAADANMHSYKRQTYKIRPTANREIISNHYHVVDKCCQRTPAVLFALERFNSGLTRFEMFDKIVDLTISIESLISGSQELSYKFALYNSFIATSDPDARREAFELLQSLYSARSGIVHGDTSTKDKKKVLDEVVNNWDNIVRIAKAALNYHLIFIQDKTKSDWDVHLKNLVLGLEARIV